MACYRLPDRAAGTEHDEAAGLGRRGGPVLRGQAAHDDPAGAQRDEPGGQPDAARAPSSHLGGPDVREQGTVTAGGNLDDRGAGALQVSLVVEVADQHVTAMQPAAALPHYCDSERVHVPVVRDSRGDVGELMEMRDAR